MLRAQISVSGNWSTTIDVNDLQTAGTPGSDVNSTTLSTTDGAIFDIDISFGVSNFMVYVARSDNADWPSAWGLAVRRTGNGIGFGGSISGGTYFVSI